MGNNRVEMDRIRSGMTNFCFRGNSPINEYLSENKIQKYLLPKVKNSLLYYTSEAIDRRESFVHKRKRLFGYELCCVLREIMEGCDYETLKTAKNYFDNDWKKGVKFLLNII